MRRIKDWAAQLLVFIEENDAEGVGLTRQELRRFFTEYQVSLGESASNLWDVVDYHLSLLESGGFVTCKIYDEYEHDREADDFMLTWAGHDLIGR